MKTLGGALTHFCLSRVPSLVPPVIPCAPPEVAPEDRAKHQSLAVQSLGPPSQQLIY